MQANMNCNNVVTITMFPIVRMATNTHWTTCCKQKSRKSQERGYLNLPEFDANTQINWDNYVRLQFFCRFIWYLTVYCFCVNKEFRLIRTSVIKPQLSHHTWNISSSLPVALAFLIHTAREPSALYTERPSRYTQAFHYVIWEKINRPHSWTKLCTCVGRPLLSPYWLTWTKGQV